MKKMLYSVYDYYVVLLMDNHVVDVVDSIMYELCKRYKTIEGFELFESQVNFELHKDELSYLYNYEYVMPIGKTNNERLECVPYFIRFPRGYKFNSVEMLSDLKNTLKNKLNDGEDISEYMIYMSKDALKGSMDCEFIESVLLSHQLGKDTKIPKEMIHA